MGKSKLSLSRSRFGLIALMAVAVVMSVAAAYADAAPPPAVKGFALQHSIGDAAVAGGSYGGLAVDSVSSQLILPNANAQTMEVFSAGASAADGPITTFGSYVIGSGLTDVAVNQADGDVYVEELFGLRRYLSDRAPTPTFTEDSSYAPASENRHGGLAVDPTTGDLILAEGGAGRIRRLSPTGALISDFPAQHLLEQVVVAPDGSIYALEVEANNEHIEHYSATGEPLGAFTDWETSNPTAIAYDTADNLILVGSYGSKGGSETGSVEISGFKPSGERAFLLQLPPAYVGEPINGTYGSSIGGLAYDEATGSLYALVRHRDSAGNPLTSLLLFETTWFPGIEAPDVSGVTTTSAHVSTNLDLGPEPPADSEARFEYSADGGKTWTSTSSADDRSGHVEADLEGLSPNLAYLVRARATNSQVSQASAATAFTTLAVPPVATTGEATGVGERSATLTARINPIGLQTTYRFEYGLSAVYEASVPVGREATAGGGRTDRAVEQTLEGLQPGTTYHYRVVAKNAAGTAVGSDLTFTTAVVGQTLARAYEQVSPVDHKGSLLETRLGFFVGHSNDAFSYQLRTPAAEGAGAPGVGRVASFRSSTGWSSKALDPPMNEPQNLINQTTKGLSSDFSHALVVSNKKLAPGAIESEEGINYYLTDVATGQETFLGSSESEAAFPRDTGLNGPGLYKELASDGRWVIFQSASAIGPEGVSGALYRWTEGDGLSVVSRLPDGTAVGVNSGTVQVSADGSRVYFNDRNGTAYLREGGSTKALSNYEGDPTLPAEGKLRGITPDGRFAFISSFLTLTPTTVENGTEVLYRFDDETGQLENTGAAMAGPEAPFYGVSGDGEIAYFSGLGGVEVWRSGTVTQIGGAGQRGSVSDNGRFFAYTTGGDYEHAYENSDIFLYTLESEENRCISCVAGASTQSSFVPNEDVWVNKPAPKVVTDDGRVFFTTSLALVPGDMNGTQDVYEYVAGHFALVSPGNQPVNSTLAAASDDGSNVYFVTDQALVSQDTNRALDIYDARVGGGIPAQNPPAPAPGCVGETCQPTSGARAAEPGIASEATSGSPAKRHRKAAKKCSKARGTRGKRAACHNKAKHRVARAKTGAAK